MSKREKDCLLSCHAGRVTTNERNKHKIISCSVTINYLRDCSPRFSQLMSDDWAAMAS
jgi:hypothetical protein